MFKAQAEVTSLWNPHSNSGCYRSVGCFCIKNIYFMLRFLFALRMVHQVVTWKTVKTESCRSKMPHGTHEELCSLIFRRILGPTLKIPMTNFMDFVWVVFFPESLRLHSMKSVISSSTLAVLCERLQSQGKTVRNCTPGPFHAGARCPSPPLLLPGTSLPSSDSVYGGPRLSCV